MSWKSGISSLWSRLPDTEIPDGIEDQEPPDETELGHFLSAVGKAHSKLWVSVTGIIVVWKILTAKTNMRRTEHCPLRNHPRWLIVLEKKKTSFKYLPSKWIMPIYTLCICWYCQYNGGGITTLNQTSPIKLMIQVVLNVSVSSTSLWQCLINANLKYQHCSFKNMHIFWLLRKVKSKPEHLDFNHWSKDREMIEFSLKFYRTKFNGEHNRTLWWLFSVLLY